MKAITERLAPHMKALVLLALIVLAAIADALGLEVGLDTGHYVGLLLADVAVWAVPNRQPDNSAGENLTRHVG